MLNENEIQSIVDAVLSAIRTNSRTIEQLTIVQEPSDSDSLELSGGKRITVGALRRLVAASIEIDEYTIKGYQSINSVDELPDTETDKGYILGTTLYVWVGEGGDAKGGKYKSVELQGKDGKPGKDGVSLGDVAIADDLDTDDPQQVLSARQGKKLAAMADGEEKSPHVTINAIETYEGKAIRKADGELVIASSVGANVKVYDIEGWEFVFASGYAPSASGANTGIGFYSGQRTFISYQEAGDSSAFEDIVVNVPTGAKFVYVFGTTTGPNSVFGVSPNTERLLALMGDVYEPESEVPAYKSYPEKYVDNASGELVSGSPSALTKEFFLEHAVADAIYYVDGRIGSVSACCLVAYYDDQMNYLSYEYAGGVAGTYLRKRICPPSNAKFVRIFGTSLSGVKVNLVAPKLYVRRRKAQKTVQQVPVAPLRVKASGEPLRVLFFGSSWFMDTWWYLNYLIKSAGINAELHAYYIGHSQMREWIELYNNDLTPFSGSESTRSATRNVSVDGGDWVIGRYRNGYTAQQFRDAFYADLTAGNWDIIAFQQGAYQAPHWRAYWEPYYKDLVNIVKRHCTEKTLIGFNSTWTMASTSSGLAPFPVNATGQRLYQEANWDATKHFMVKSGIVHVSPCGKTMWNLRNSELTDESELAGDGIHPSNGLPIYALGLTWFQTFIAPMYGIDGDTIDWLPTASTPKALVSGDYYVSINETQRDLVRQLVKKALSNRFDFDDGSAASDYDISYIDIGHVPADEYGYQAIDVSVGANTGAIVPAASGHTWSTGTAYKGRCFDVSDKRGWMLRIRHGDSFATCNFAFLNAAPVNNQPISYCDGETYHSGVSEVVVNVPSDATLLYVQRLSSGGNVMTPVVEILTKDKDTMYGLEYKTSGKADRRRVVDNSQDASVVLAADTYNQLGTTDAPVVTLPASYTAADEFLYSFTCATDACVVTLPQGVVLADGCDDFGEVAAGVWFQVSIMDGVAAYLCVTPQN